MPPPHEPSVVTLTPGGNVTGAGADEAGGAAADVVLGLGAAGVVVGTGGGAAAEVVGAGAALLVLLLGAGAGAGAKPPKHRP